ncbi:PREDICTED: nudix hydrolase 11 isoform X2 [Tarenaya hassleriana]|uniref:nudix hydrolase 11 isoform X2 n=1 Tax=Tarenaya hassleriana TaxID=28532 RepID=UPI00053C5D9C|nr:PREDICTED: nudix hydrolase 11 isoform X2 [Tarenaya hassleriana]
MSGATEFNKLQTLIRRLRSYKPNVLSSQENFPGKSSAVLVCLYLGDDGELHVILTKRSSNLSSHSDAGEVALPGGKRDEGDSDDVATALREAHEEIGLDPSLVTVASVLEPFITKRGMSVAPVIGFLTEKEAFKPDPNTAEVEEIFDAPLEMFLKNENRRAEEREHEGQRYLLHYFDYKPEDKQKNFTIWALTAGILIRVASLVYQRSSEFLELKPEFWNQPKI